MRTIRGPGIFLAQFAGDAAPFNSLPAIADWVAKTPWVDFLATSEAIRSNTSVCLKIVDPAITALPAEGQAAFVKKIPALLEAEKIALGSSFRRASQEAM